MGFFSGLFRRSQKSENEYNDEYVEYLLEELEKARSEKDRTIEAQEELMVVGDSGRYVRGYEEAGMDIDNLSIKQKIIDKLSVNDGNADKICRIILYLRQNPYSSTASIAEMLGVSVSSAKIYLRRLVGAGFIVPHGANKNRTYSLSGRQSKA